MPEKLYEVNCRCQNCKWTYLVYAEKGKALPAIMKCPHCETVQLKKISEQLGGYHGIYIYQAGVLLPKEVADG
jgi:hypothetical protein